MITARSTELVARPPVCGELLSARDMVRVVARVQHPLKGGRIDITLLAGLTVDECLDRALGVLKEREFTVYITDGNSSVPIRREVWGKVRPKPGTTITARPTVHGGGALKVVLMLAITVAAFLVAGPAASAFALEGSLLYTGISAAISAGILFAGVSATSALFSSVECPLLARRDGAPSPVEGS